MSAAKLYRTHRGALILDPSEGGLDQRIEHLAAMTGWKRYHTHNSKNSPEGWPDLVLANAELRRVLFVELKDVTRQPTQPQKDWLGVLSACGLECALWRPQHWEHIAEVLGRGAPLGGDGW